MLFTAPYNPNGTNQYPDGNNYTDIVEGADGFLYVVASSGAQSSNVAQPGTLIRISKSGTGYEVVHRFCSAPNCTDGAEAWKLVLGSDGNFYGAAGHGGSFTCYLGCGTIFRLSTDGTYTVLYSPVSGQTTVGALNVAADGNFYALCSPPISGPPSVCRVTTSGQVTPIFQFPSGRWPANVYLTQGSDGFLYGVDGPPSSISYQVIFQLSTSGSYREIYQINAYCTPKTGCSRVMQASDGNLWIADPPQDSIYSISTTGTLLQTISFSSQPNRASHDPQLLVQASSGILFGTTGEPNPAYGAVGSVFSLDAGLPPPK